MIKKLISKVHFQCQIKCWYRHSLTIPMSGSKPGHTAPAFEINFFYHLCVQCLFYCHQAVSEHMDEIPLGKKNWNSLCTINTYRP